VAGIYNRADGCPPALADLMSVSHESATNSYIAWVPRTNYLPLVTGGQRPEFLEATNIKARVIAGDLDPRTVVLLEKNLQASAKAVAGALTTVEVTRFAAHEIGFHVTSDAPAWVVVSQTYYPAWKAWINRSPAPLIRANHAFLALEVPAGESQVRLAYVDQRFHLGVVISALSLAGCLIGLRPSGGRTRA
jgi:hypothetical protein